MTTTFNVAAQTSNDQVLDDRSTSSLMNAVDLLGEMAEIQAFLSSSAISELSLDVRDMLTVRQGQLLTAVASIVVSCFKGS